MRQTRSSLSPGITAALLAALFVAGQASGLTAQDKLAATVQGLQKRYAAVNTITAHFQQNYRAPGIEQHESGVFQMKKPGLMRWDYQSPESKVFVANGRETYLYTPADRQVVMQKFSPEELHSTPLQFLLGQGDLLRSFSASWETQSRPKLQSTVLLRLVPRDPQAEYAYLVLELDSGTSDIRRMVIHERTGNSSEFILTDVSTNVKIDGKQFDFKIPKGVEVVRLDEK